ncbi:pyrroline-5-carboxylate reductase dimerization domain-containing protein [Rhizobium sp. 32-5/1]|uniref:pyrroline-5-carboxylate reductase family protein n=1 Tax=Rhizobium sp. 32-5/1 TaxID=3019602 RepID=UPI00240D41B1|nr:pyrroline-5-carboxylate reductase dimerization domain-containing protein [Rhizobium sp. 32-5/1]WEZ84778.1 pyrroline-5-carboxylate reductase dimerization domain-containing protein [Rhizobium sp. 32-5/1]
MTTLGVIGGTGWLAGALLRPALTSGFISPSNLVLSSRSGGADGFEAWSDIRFTTDNAVLAAACNVVILSVRPEDLGTLDLDLSGKLVISVMARVKAKALMDRFGTGRIIRAMPNASAEQGLSFTPWFATSEVTVKDEAFADGFFACSGKTTRLKAENELDYFTALTGSGPAFIAAFADVMIRDAVANGVSLQVADAAVRQLFLGAATWMAHASESPAETVKVFTDYGGTTAAGLTAMKAADIETPIRKGLAASAKRAATA